MKKFQMCFEMWKSLMTSNSSNMIEYQSMFWDYLNYSYIRQEWSIESEWKWNK
jgi:hypothetical protein